MRVTYAGLSRQTAAFQVIPNVLLIKAWLLFAHTDRRWPKTRAVRSSIAFRRQHLT